MSCVSLIASQGCATYGVGAAGPWRADWPTRTPASVIEAKIEQHRRTRLGFAHLPWIAGPSSGHRGHVKAQMLGLANRSTHSHEHQLQSMEIMALLLNGTELRTTSRVDGNCRRHLASNSMDRYAQHYNYPTVHVNGGWPCHEGNLGSRKQQDVMRCRHVPR